jgi:hypothetical protein
LEDQLAQLRFNAAAADLQAESEAKQAEFAARKAAALEAEATSQRNIKRLALETHHLESCTPGTRQYKVVRTGTYQYILFWIRGGTRNVKIVHTSTYQYVRTYDISMAVHTGMYWYVLYGTRRYKEVQPSTRRYMVVQGTVQGGTRQYVLVCTGMY